MLCGCFVLPTFRHTKSLSRVCSSGSLYEISILRHTFLLSYKAPQPQHCSKAYDMLAMHAGRLLSTISAPEYGVKALVVGKDRMFSLGRHTALLEWDVVNPLSTVEDPRLRTIHEMPWITCNDSVRCIQVCPIHFVKHPRTLKQGSFRVDLNYRT
jgi:hypothetical protein